jgi:hypothetical protein
VAVNGTGSRVHGFDAKVHIPTVHLDGAILLHCDARACQFFPGDLIPTKSFTGDSVSVLLAPEWEIP